MQKTLVLSADMFSCFFGGCFSGVLPSETREKRKRCCYISHKMEFPSSLILLQTYRWYHSLPEFLDFAIILCIFKFTSATVAAVGETLAANMVVKPAPGIVSCPDQKDGCSQHSYIIFLPSQEEVIRSIWANSCFFCVIFCDRPAFGVQYISSYFHRSCTLPGVGKIPEDCARDRGHTDVVWLQDSKTEACRCPCQLPTRSVEAGHFASTQGRFLAANWNWKTGKTGRCC